jgi:DHA2 family lincomycin resistance protein-like MFS transporter
MGLAGPFIGRLYDRVGPRPLIVPGSIVVSLAFWGMTLFSASTPWYLVLVAHIGISVGLAFMFTPLFTSSMAALNPRLYSHGSATISTVQQLAGAAGTALFIALYTIGTFTARDAGATEVDALANGVHIAFMAGASISLLAVVAAWFVPKPVEFDHAAAAAGH